jgi:hypothetical protein
LVDPELASVARVSLPDARAIGGLNTPPPVRARVDANARARAALAKVALAVDDDHGSPTRAGRSWRVLIGVAALTTLSLVLFDVRVQVGKTPASAEAPQNPPAIAGTPSRALVPSVPRTRVQKGSVGDVAKPMARRFAWAPAAGASAYHIEFFRGSVQVFSANTTRPQLTVPAHWKAAGGTRSLDPGEYRWYVWTVVSGTRSSTAIVRARLVVS